MKKLIFVLFIAVCFSFVMASERIILEPLKKQFKSDELVSIKVTCQPSEDSTWDTYLYFTDSRKTPIYVNVEGNSLSPVVLGMLSPKIELKPRHWSKDEVVHLFVYLCKSDTQKVITIAHTTFEILVANNVDKPSLPTSAQLLLSQETVSHPNDRYSDYKQFDSTWKTVLMGQYNGTTIGASGCAISAVGNISGTTPSTMNSNLKSDGGYSGNSIIWGKARGLSYYGSGSMSDSLFNSYHVIADVGGHFVLLTGLAGTEKYNSKDPGKSSNPVYTKGQIYSVRLYYK